MLPSCFFAHRTVGIAQRAGATRRMDFSAGATALAMFVALVLAGCNATSPQAVAAPAAEPKVEQAPPAPEPTIPDTAPTVAPGPQAAERVGQVLARTDRTLRMAPAELTKEIARLSESEDATADTPLLLATALAQTRQPVDTARALGLVQRVLASNAEAAQALHPLARLMEARLLQQRRLEEQLERQTQQLREAQRRNDQLNERLEAVRAIERSLTTRPGPLPGAPASAPAGGTPPRPAP